MVIPRIDYTDDGLRLTLRNASAAVASAVRPYTGSGGIATIRERPSDLTLFPGEDMKFHLDFPKHAEQADVLTVLWGGVAEPERVGCPDRHRP